jgi:hypothetical protein
MPSSFHLTADYPGGNILVDRIAGDDVFLRQELRDTEGFWFYWNFEVCGAAGRALTFHFTDGDVLGTRGPAMSGDGGATWRWLGGGEDMATFSYTFAPEDISVHFAFSVPYTGADWARFVTSHAGHPRLRPAVLCQSRAGRAVECLVVGESSATPRQRVLLTCRHHCCETMASFVLEGLLDAVLKCPTPALARVAAETEFLVVPFVDKDGVEAGDQGKNRRPHDHNRDYQHGLYPETVAVRTLVSAWSAGELAVALDLHCPWIRGPHNEVIYLVGSRDARIWTEQQRFGQCLEGITSGSLPYHSVDNLPFGVAWNTGANFDGGLSCSQWAATLPGLRLATSLEFPYANVGAATVTPAGARAFGADLAAALAQYLAVLA